MAQKKNDRNTEGVCRKIYNAVSPLRATIRRISHQPQGSILSRTSDAPALAQPVLTKMIPIELESPARDKEIVIANGKKVATSVSRKRGLAQAEKAHPVMGSFSKAKSKNDDDPSAHEAKFSDYINKVKNRMMKAVSNVGHEKGA